MSLCLKKNLLHLLKADFFASFIWNPSTPSFGDPVLLNMCPANVARYEIHHQFHDPIIHLLQKRRRATLVCEVMDQEALEKTEFFNDFLKKDGLHHGMNLYAYTRSVIDASIKEIVKLGGVVKEVEVKHMDLATPTGFNIVLGESVYLLETYLKRRTAHRSSDGGQAF